MSSLYLGINSLKRPNEQGSKDKAPVPYIRQAAGATLQIIVATQAAKGNKAAFRQLAKDAAFLIAAFWKSYQVSSNKDRWPPSELADVMDDLVSTLDSIQHFVEVQVSRNWFLQILFSVSEARNIQGYRQRLDACITKFEVLRKQGEISEHLTDSGKLRTVGKKIASPNATIAQAGAQNIPTASQALIRPPHPSQLSSYGSGPSSPQASQVTGMYPDYYEDTSFYRPPSPSGAILSMGSRNCIGGELSISNHNNRTFASWRGQLIIFARLYAGLKRYDVSRKRRVVPVLDPFHIFPDPKPADSGKFKMHAKHLKARAVGHLRGFPPSTPPVNNAGVSKIPNPRFFGRKGTFATITLKLIPGN
ncbi:hypothetical protein BDZ97DRAFT_1762270 [Flammula alnicola]|nr:hypothetical protein BDZ97DRAFT_1762270 [Flammula alnicola]